MPPHTHDDIDWSARLVPMRRREGLERPALAEFAARFGRDLGDDPVVVDVGCGSKGMSVALFRMLTHHGGGTLVLVDVTEELPAEAAASAADVGGPAVRVETVHADLATTPLPGTIPEADLIWAAAVVHHLPDQQAGIDNLAATPGSGGRLALPEGGLDSRSLPRDLGGGRPGFEHRLHVAYDAWFQRLRADMPEAVSLPYGWTTALRRAGLSDADSAGFLIERSAPAQGAVLEHVIERLTWFAETLAADVAEEDHRTLRRLIDTEDTDYLGARDDVYLLDARTVHTARRR